MQYRITYKQTAGERFETGMNDEVRRTLQAYGLVIESEVGGTDMQTEIADQSFTVEGAYATAKAATDALSVELGRKVEMEAL